ncbi:GntR family transcriptional regulator [Klebsiella michiganensis]|nr:GntR family transcriptional regulator [Klebsiella michiganensis]
MTRYQHLVSLLAERIEQGLYRPGEKLPSVRSLSQEHGVSISTVQQAYQTLEQQQLIVPQPRSGYFVAPRKAQPPVPPMSRPVQRPVEITQWDQVLTMLDARHDKSIIPFGGGSPDVTQPSLKPIWRELSRAIQHNLSEVLNYDELVRTSRAARTDRPPDARRRIGGHRQRSGAHQRLPQRTVAGAAVGVSARRYRRR